MKTLRQVTLEIFENHYLNNSRPLS